MSRERYAARPGPTPTRDEWDHYRKLREAKEARREELLSAEAPPPAPDRSRAVREFNDRKMIELARKTHERWLRFPKGGGPPQIVELGERADADHVRRELEASARDGLPVAESVARPPRRTTHLKPSD